MRTVMAVTIWTLCLGWLPLGAMSLPERHRQREYGKCASCNGPLGEIRLKLMPTAEMCASCQKAEDARLVAKRTAAIKDAPR